MEQEFKIDEFGDREMDFELLSFDKSAYLIQPQIGLYLISNNKCIFKNFDSIDCNFKINLNFQI